jgi:hypothetical protein
MGQEETAMTRKSRIMIFGPKSDGTYVVEFRTADGEPLAISIPRTESTRCLAEIDQHGTASIAAE